MGYMNEFSGMLLREGGRGRVVELDEDGFGWIRVTKCM